MVDPAAHEFTPNPALEKDEADQTGFTESEQPVQSSEARSYSDAAASPFFPEFELIGSVLSFITGRASLAYRVIQALLVILGAALAIALPQALATAHGWGGPNTLLRVAGACFSLVPVFALYPLADARRCLHPGPPAADTDGPSDDDDRLVALRKLGAGMTRITDADAKGLNRWRKATVGFYGLFVVPVAVIIGIVVPVAIVAGGFITETTELVQVVALFVSLGLALATLVPIILFGWGISMKVAAALVRDEILEVVIPMEQVSPADDDAWQTKVVEPALALRGTLQRLSDGWGAGLAGLTMACWALALGFFTMAVNTPICVDADDLLEVPRGTSLIMNLACTIAFAVLPLFLGLDLAAISTRCDVMMAALNEVRLRHGESHHLRVTWLETGLQRQNGGQGPGFTARFFFDLAESDLDSGTVLNTEKLKKSGASLITGIVTVATYLIAIADEAAAKQEDAVTGICELGARNYTLVDRSLAPRCAKNKFITSAQPARSTGQLGDVDCETARAGRCHCLPLSAGPALDNSFVSGGNGGRMNESE
jgi:hypothetical protein